MLSFKKAMTTSYWVKVVMFFLFLSADKSRPCVLFGWFRQGKKVFSLRHVYGSQNVTNLPDVLAASSRMHKEKYNLIALLERVFSLSYCF